LRLTTPLNLPAPGRRQCVYVALRGFARTCVFAKQSLGPIHCDPGQQQTRSLPPPRAPLLPKLRGQYAEFLDHVSLVHLRLLASPTCVGLRYGHLVDSLPGFSCPPTPLSLTVGLPLRSRHQVSDLAVLRPFTTVHMIATASFRGPPEVHHLPDGAGISTGYPSSTPLGPRLRVRLTLR
jgi:hypothetical protein